MEYNCINKRTVTKVLELSCVMLYLVFSAANGDRRALCILCVAFLLFVLSLCFLVCVYVFFSVSLFLVLCALVLVKLCLAVSKLCL